jgi:diadenosine tetraphosphate (Ap4A) HIT family hydrolase
LIVPNQHAACLSELAEETGAQMFRTAQRLAQALRDSGIKCEGVNFFLADGEVAGQEIFHVHLHVFPRYKGDGFGFKFAPTFFTKTTRAELDAMAEQIRKCFFDPEKRRIKKHQFRQGRRNKSYVGSLFSFQLSTAFFRSSYAKVPIIKLKLRLR